MPLDPPIYLLAGLLGLALGSLLNVVTYRLPRGLGLRARSSCTYCGGRIALRDNLPIASYLLLRGRCRLCGAPISARYPLLEAATALLSVAAVHRFGVGGELLAALVLICLLLALAVIDVEHLLLPDRLTLPGILAGLALQPWLREATFLEALVGALVGAGLLVLTSNVLYWLQGSEGLGLGDVNLLALIGAFLGWKGALVALVLSIPAAAVVTLALIVSGRLRFTSKVPFGAYLALGGLAALFWGSALVEVYLRLR